MEITIRCERINDIHLNSLYHPDIKVSLENVYEDELLDQIGLEKVIDYYINEITMSKLLDEIGIEYVKEHFGLIEPSSSEAVATGTSEAILKEVI